jgi:outer membrane protein assembly factor BamB
MDSARSRSFARFRPGFLLRKLALAALLCSALWSIAGADAAAVDPGRDWPEWRGPNGNGIAAPGQNPPAQWSETSNILWKTAIPGRGHGSPTIVGNQVYLEIADAEKGSQSVLCLDRTNGKELWRTVVHPDGADPGHHANSSAASSSVACDGEQVYANFLNGGAVTTTALSTSGKILWQQKVANFMTHQGFASSPIPYESLVLVSADNRGGGAVAGLDKKTGKIAWSVDRPKIPNYTSPALLRAAGRPQLVIAGCNLMTSLDPLTGKKLWEIPGSTEECVGSVVTDGERVFAGGGWPRNHTAAVMADGSGKIAWQNNARVYVPSMIVKEGHLYAVLDAGMAVCWKSDTGEEMWKERLGGDFFSSPVMVGNRIYASNVNGATFVYEATPAAFKLVSKNQLGNETYASPVICGGNVYLRTANRGETRQEYIYCIADQNSEALR